MQKSMLRSLLRKKLGLLSLSAAGFAVVGMSSISGAAVTLPVTGGMGFPNGGGAGFESDFGQPYEVLINTVNSPVETVSENIGGGDTYDLKFYIQTQIYKDYQTNPNGTVDFVYQLHNVSSDNGNTIIGDSITRLTLQSFANYGVTADYIYNSGQSATSSDAPPVSIDRSTSPGAVIGYNFQGYDSSNTYQPTPLIPGTFSDYLVVRTNALSYTDGTASVIGGLGESGLAEVPYGAAVSVPEPVSSGFAAVACGAMLSRRRRSRVA